MALRYGVTTGACASAAACAAMRYLVTGARTQMVSLPLGRGMTADFDIVSLQKTKAHEARASVIKDAGDDPDCTDGALVSVTVRREKKGYGVRFSAGKGVGIVTKEGLPLKVGEPAINPAPRAMIETALKNETKHCNASWDCHVTIAIKDGKNLAKKTLNARLGIVGGLSVLGTSGVVVPFSCAAWIASIHQGIDVAHAQGHVSLAAAVGTKSMHALQQFNFREDAIIDMGDFIGATIKYLRKKKFMHSFTIAGGFAKMTKWAQGAKDLHHKRSSVDKEQLVQILQKMGANSVLCEEVRSCASSSQIRLLAERAGFDLAQAIAHKGAMRLRDEAHCMGRVLIVSSQGDILADEKCG